MTPDSHSIPFLLEEHLMLDTNYGEFSEHGKTHVYWQELKSKAKLALAQRSLFVFPLKRRINEPER